MGLIFVILILGGFANTKESLTLLVFNEKCNLQRQPIIVHFMTIKLIVWLHAFTLLLLCQSSPHLYVLSYMVEGYWLLLVSDLCWWDPYS